MAVKFKKVTVLLSKWCPIAHGAGFVLSGPLELQTWL